MAFTVIRKSDSADEHLVFGWASVSVHDGELVTDLQNDIIDPSTLENAVYDFMENYRAQLVGGAGVNHETEPMCEVVASLVTTPEICKAFGLGDNVPVGWILGLRVNDEGIWKRVVSGELGSFSIQGSAEREEIMIEEVV